MMQGSGVGMGMIRAGVLGLLLMTGGAGAMARDAAPDGRHIVETGSSHGAPACMSCHGADLQGNDAIRAPALAGRPQAYLSGLAPKAGGQARSAR